MMLMLEITEYFVLVDSTVKLKLKYLKLFFNGFELQVKLEPFRSSHFGSKSFSYWPVCMGSHRQFQRRNLYNGICFTVKLKRKDLYQRWKSKTRVTSSNLRGTGSNLRVASSNPRGTSSNPQLRTLKTRAARLKA